MIRDTPQTMPRLNQLVKRCRLVPAANSNSPSLDEMLRDAMEVAAAGADQGPDHRQRRARQGAAADADRGAVGHQRRRRFERGDLFAQAAVALAGARQKLAVGDGQQRSPNPAAALNSAISASQAGTERRSPAQKLLASAPLERRERHALLLDPGIVAEIEDPRTLVMGQFEHVVVGDAERCWPNASPALTASKPSG